MSYEASGSTVAKYYYARATRIAMRKQTVLQNLTLTYLFGDHLTSTSLTVDMRFPRRLCDTNSCRNGGCCLFCKKMTSSSYINHFLQPDSIIPDPTNPQAWNRYSYVANNPINFNDPTGHCPEEDAACRDQMIGMLPVQGLNSSQKIHLAHTSEGLWRLGINLNDFQSIQRGTEIVVATEYGGQYYQDLYDYLDQAMTRRYFEYCDGAATSNRCINSFWGYMQGILEAASPDGADKILKQYNDVQNSGADSAGKAAAILNPSVEDWRTGCQMEGVEQLCEWASISSGQTTFYSKVNGIWNVGNLPNLIAGYPAPGGAWLVITTSDKQRQFCYEATSVNEMCNLTTLP